MSRRLGPVLVTLAMVAPLPASAAAATRYAAPSGAASGSCTNPFAPCTIGTALGVAGAGDEVVLAPGLYTNQNANAALPVPANVTLRGAPGRERPLIDQPRAFTSCTTCANVSLGAGATLRHVRVRQLPAGGGALSVPVSATVEDVLAEGARGALIVRSGGAAGVARDSAFRCTAATCHAVSVTGGGADLRNVTAVALGTGGVGIDVATGSSSAPVSGVNVVAQGALRDVAVHTGDVTLRYSSFDPAKVLQAGSSTFAGSDHRAGVAVLVDPASGDLREAPGSPTIDAGTDPGRSGGDPDGHPRVIGRAPDVGAYERRPAPLTSLLAPGAISRTSATVNGVVDPLGGPAVVIVQWGPSVAYGFTVPVLDAGTGTGPLPVSATLGGLVAGATYHYRFATFNDGGLVFTPDATVTTAPPRRVARPRRAAPRDAVTSKRAAARRGARPHARRAAR
jgi:hypothetical protein